MIRLIPFACTSSHGEAALITIAATIRWANVRGRLPAARRSATPTHIITRVQRRRRDETVGVIARLDQYHPLLLGPDRIATACKGANGAIPAIANSPATPNAWRPRAVLTPIAGSIPSTRSRTSDAAPIGAGTERQRSNIAARPSGCSKQRCNGSQLSPPVTSNPINVHGP